MNDEQIDALVRAACHSDPSTRTPGEYCLTTAEIRALLSASIADTAGAKPVAWAVYWGLGQMRQNSVHFERETAAKVASEIKSHTEIRPLYAAPPAPSVADAAGASEPFGWVQPKGGNYFTRSETTAKRIGGLVPVYLGAKESGND